MKPLRTAVIQNSATADMDANLERLDSVLSLCEGADLVALPEVFALRGSSRRYRENAQPLDGPLVSNMRAAARKFGAWLLAGTIIEKRGSRRYNTCVLIDRSGRIRAVYRKIHLFEARLDDTRIIRESDDYSPGREPVLASIEGWRVGLSVCYDLRFPELFRFYAANGAHALLVPSNFTARTGTDHWEILVRARAIENQCFLVAPNQCGVNEETGVASHGHSCVIGPWGEILAMAGRKPCVIRAVLEPSRLHEIRDRIPALKHMRRSLFQG